MKLSGLSKRLADVWFMWGWPSVFPVHVIVQIKDAFIGGVQCYI